MKKEHWRSAAAAALALMMLLALPLTAGASDADFHLRFDVNDVIIGYSVWGDDPTTPETVCVPMGTKGIADNALAHLKDTERLNLSYDLPWVGNEGLAYNPKLTTFIFPENIQSIGSKALAGNTGLLAVSFFGVPDYVAPDIFEGCTSLRQIEFWGTQEQWHALNLQLPPNNIFIFGPDFQEHSPSGPSHGQEPLPIPEPEINVASSALQGIEQLSLRLNSDSGLLNAGGGALTLLQGIRAAKNEGSGVDAATLLGNLSTPFDAEILCKDGTQAHDHEGIATGDMVAIYKEGTGEPVDVVSIVVTGDVLGTGVMDCAQIVRAARALNGTEPLTGVFQMAACTAGCVVSHPVTINDLVDMARMLTADTAA